MPKGKATRIEMGAYAFDTRTEAETAIREVLYSVNLGAMLTAEMHDFVCLLLARHPKAAEKIGAGVDHFTVDDGGNHSQTTRAAVALGVATFVAEARR